MVIDADRLPEVALIDTGVLIRALGHKPEDARSPDAAAFFEAMICAKRRMLVAAPTLAELERGQPDRHAAPVPLPRTRYVIIVPFDEVAAVTLAKEFPMAIITSAADETGLSRSQIKYDALIAACAIRHGATCIVSLDEKAMKRRYGTKLPVLQPRDFARAPDQQTSFDLREAAPMTGPLQPAGRDDNDGTHRGTA